MINPNIGKYVTRALAKRLKTVVETDLSMVFFVEGVDLEKKDWFQMDSVVLRVTGPTPKFGPGVTRYKFSVMCMITDLVDDSENGFLNLERSGAIGNSLSAGIEVQDDTPAAIGCLAPDRDAKDFLRIVPFGKLDKDNEVVQTAVIAEYEICL